MGKGACSLLCRTVSRHAAFDAAVHCFLRVAAYWAGHIPLDGGDAWVNIVHKRIPDRNLAWVCLPQAMRIAVPPTVGFSVQVVKGTAVASIIGFVELTKAGTMITNATYAPFTVYGFVAVMYFLICYPLSLFARHLEGKFRHVAR